MYLLTLLVVFWRTTMIDIETLLITRVSTMHTFKTILNLQNLIDSENILTFLIELISEIISSLWNDYYHEFSYFKICDLIFIS